MTPATPYCGEIVKVPSLIASEVFIVISACAEFPLSTVTVYLKVYS